VAESNVTPLRVGVIGAHTNWRKRFRAALFAERERYVLRWLYDETYQRSAAEAKPLGIPAVDGLTEAMSDPELDAVLLLEDEWYHLWPLELACKLQKPIFCVPHLASDPENLQSIVGQPAFLGMPDAPVHFHRPARQCLATRRLQRLLLSRLGAARLVFWQSSANAYSLADAIDWCLHLFPNLPVAVQKVFVGPTQAWALETFVLDFGNGRAAQISLLADAPQKARVHLIAERGAARLGLPNRLAWATQGNVFRERLRLATTPERQALREFHAMVTGSNRAPVDLDAERRTCAVMRMLAEPAA
jgi:hypothetical protein